MKLNEIVKAQTSPLIVKAQTSPLYDTNKINAIADFLNHNGVTRYKINKDYSVDVSGDVIIRDKYVPVLRVKFGKVSGIFDISQCNLETLEGCPVYVGQSFSASENHLTSLQYCPRHVGHTLALYLNPMINSFKGIEKQIDYIGAGIQFDLSEVQSHILGICLIKGNPSIDCGDDDFNNIFNTYKHDINLCQEALIEAGYEKYARL